MPEPVFAARPPGERLRDRWPTAAGVALVPVFLLTGAWEVFVGAAVVYVLFGAFRRTRRTGPWLVATCLALVGFGVLNIVALAGGDETLRWVAAAGWLAHAVWDLVHHRADRIAPRWWAELCMVTDVLLAAALALFPQVVQWQDWLRG